MSEDVARLIISVEDTGVPQATRHLQQMERAGGKAERSTDKLRRTIGGLRGIIAAAGGAFAFREVVQASDQFQQLNAQLRLVSGSVQEAEARYDDLLAISQDTRSELGSSIELYAKLARSTEALGLEQADILDLTKSVNQAFKISGASSAESAGAIRQLAQAFASGTLRGDEFNSVNEQAPRLMEAVAKGLGVQRGELRKLAEEGKLTADVVSRALLNQAETIDEEFSKIPVTVGDAMQQLKNDALDAFGRTDTSGLVDAIGEIRDLINDPVFRDNMVALGTGIADALGVAAKSISNVVGLAKEMGISIARATTESSDELFNLQESLAFLERAQSNALLRFNVSGTSTGFELYMDDAEIEREINLVRDRINELLLERGLEPLGENGESEAKGKGKGGKVRASVVLDGEETELTPLQKRIAALELEAKTIAMSEKAAELYRLKLEGANDEQLRAAGIALDTIEAEEGLTAARESAAAAAETRQRDFAQLVEDLKAEERVIVESYKKRRQLIIDNTQDDPARQSDLLGKLDADYKSDILDGFGSEKDDFASKRQKIEDEYAQRMALIEELEGEQTELELELGRRRNEQLEELESERRQQINDGYIALLDVMGEYYEGMEGKEAAYMRTAIKLGQTLLDEKKRESLNKIIANTESAAMGAYDALSSIPYIGPALGAAAAGAIYVAGGAAAGKVAGLYDNGGDIPAGKVGIVGEIGPEIVRGPATVTSRKETAAMARDAANGGGGDGRPVVVQNIVDPSLVLEALNSPDGEDVIKNIMSRNRNLA